MIKIAIAIACILFGVIVGCGGGSKQSNTSNPSIAIATQPTSQTVSVGENATFNVSVSTTTATYQWQVSSDSGNTWENLIGGTGSQLTIPSATQGLSGNEYRALIFDGSITATSTVATLSVIAKQLLLGNSYDFSSGDASNLLEDLGLERATSTSGAEQAGIASADRANLLTVRRFALTTEATADPVTRYPAQTTTTAGSNPPKPFTELAPNGWHENTGPICEAGAGHGGFCKYNCTEYVFERREQVRASIGLSLPTLEKKDMPSGASAKDWVRAYKADSRFAVGTVPRPGAILIRPNMGSFGHVQFVERVWNTGDRVTGFLVTDRNNSKNMDGKLRKRCFGTCPSMLVGNADFDIAQSTPEIRLNSADFVFVYLTKEDLGAYAVSATPIPPSSTSANRLTNGNVVVSWTAPSSTSGVAGFIVYRDGIEVGRSNATTWADRGLPTSQSACYSAASIYLDNKLSTPTEAACVLPNVFTGPFLSPTLTASCIGDAADLSWTNGRFADKATIIRSGEIIDIVAASTGLGRYKAPQGSTFVVRLSREGGESVESPATAVQCGIGTQPSISETVLPSRALTLDERMLNGMSSMPWFITAKVPFAGSNTLSAYEINSGAVLVGDLFGIDTTINEAIASINGLSVLGIGSDGSAYIYSRASRAPFTAGLGWIQTQIAGVGTSFPIDTRLASNLLAKPWVMTSSPRKDFVAITNNSSTALDGTTPIWLFQLIDGRALLVNTIRITGTFVRGITLGDAYLYAQGGDGILRKYAILGDGSLNSQIVLSQPSDSSFGELACSDDRCVSRVPSTGLLEISDFRLGTSKVTRFGLLSINKFGALNQTIVVANVQAGNCVVSVFSRDSGQLLSSAGTDCHVTSTQLYGIDRMAIYDSWSGGGIVMVSTTELRDASGLRTPAKVLRWAISGVN